MIKTKKQYAPEYKARLALEAVEGDMTLAELSSSYGLHSNNILNWKKELVENASVVFQRKIDTKKAEEELRKKRRRDRRTLQADWQAYSPGRLVEKKI